MMLLRNPWFQNLSFTSPAVGGPQCGGKDASTEETTEVEAERPGLTSTGYPWAGPVTARPAGDAARRTYAARSPSPGRPTDARDAGNASRPGDQGPPVEGKQLARGGEGALRPTPERGLRSQDSESSHATQKVTFQESSFGEHPDRNGGREAAEAGRGDRSGNAEAGWWGEAAAKGAIVGPRASPDIVGVCRDWGLIVEAKLSVTPQAEEQLLRYKAVCRDVWPERRWVLVQAVRNWRAGVPYWVVGPGSWERARRMVAWHFQAA